MNLHVQETFVRKNSFSSYQERLFEDLLRIWQDLWQEAVNIHRLLQVLACDGDYFILFSQQQQFCCSLERVFLSELPRQKKRIDAQEGELKKVLCLQYRVLKDFYQGHLKKILESNLLILEEYYDQHQKNKDSIFLGTYPRSFSCTVPDRVLYL